MADIQYDGGDMFARRKGIVMMVLKYMHGMPTRILSTVQKLYDGILVTRIISKTYNT
jgi:hypothetical protein